jgi:uncharacterized membrane protein (DUF4010 family)
VSDELQGALGMLGAALGGAAIGVERQRSGHATGSAAHFAGVRTFTLLGGFAGAAGWLWATGRETPAAVLLAGAAALVVAAYVAASRRDVDGTTEAAALVTLAAGFFAGTGQLALASGMVALTTLLLVEKSRLHGLVARLDDEELRAAARFAVMAVVVLPLLPRGPYGPLGGVRPRELWLLVLIFSGLGFAGYIARRAVGARHGYLVAGALGGLLSSTSVTFTFARASHREERQARPLALGAVAASTVLFVRTIVATAILHPALALALVPYLAAPFTAGAAAVALGARSLPREGAVKELPRNPLQVWPALQMAIVFQLVLFAVHVVRDRFGRAGLLASGAVLGLTDVDALTISMAKSAAAGVPIATAALAIAIGVLANTLLKLVAAVALGGPAFRRPAAMGLAAMAVASVVSLAVLR